MPPPIVLDPENDDAEIYFKTGYLLVDWESLNVVGSVRVVCEGCDAKVLGMMIRESHQFIVNRVTAATGYWLSAGLLCLSPLLYLFHIIIAFHHCPQFHLPWSRTEIESHVSWNVVNGHVSYIDRSGQSYTQLSLCASERPAMTTMEVMVERSDWWSTLDASLNTEYPKDLAWKIRLANFKRLAG